jgi:chitinase
MATMTGSEAGIEREDTLPEAPESPRRQLSLPRVLLAILIVIAVAVSALYGIGNLIDNSGAARTPFFAPYVDVTLTPTLAFEDATVNPAREVLLGFVVADPAAPCTPSWGGAYSLDGAGSSLDLDRRIVQLRQAGGQAMVSFGGQRNTELAVGCQDEAALAAAYAAVVSRYKVETVDFDIEGTALQDLPSLQRRARAVKAAQDQVRSAGGKLAVWLTLPVATNGMDGSALAAVDAMLAAHVDLAGVNLMTMDFGSADHPETEMGAAVERALMAGHDQLASAYGRAGLRLNSRSTWSRLGATAMIGQNDVPKETFGIPDAYRLAAFANRNGMARVSLWSLNRDSQCGTTFARLGVRSNACSGVAQEGLQFTHIFGGLRGSSSQATEPVTVPDPTPVPADDAAASPYPIWQPGQMYRASYKVVWHGNVYEAKWFSQGNPPDAAVHFDWETPWRLVGPVLPGDHAPVIPTLKPGTYPDWTATARYAKGTQVLYQGLPYQARFSTQGDQPDGYQADPQSPWTPLFAIPGEPPS